MKILIAAGGTGGHIYPALAVADALKKHSAEILWLGTRKRLEAQLVPKYYPIQYIEMTALRGRGLKTKLFAPWHLIKAIIQARQMIKQFKPDLLLAMGGFICGPAGVAAKLCGVPLMIHEQNVIAGMTNQLLAKVANSVLQAFPHTFSPSIKVHTVGNPIRSDLLTLEHPEPRLAQHKGQPRLLIIGGSQGAHFLNQKIVELVTFMNSKDRPKIWHQTGVKDEAEVKAAYQALNCDAIVSAYIDDMNKAYAFADLVISRAGALTVSELASCGVASILVPFPYATCDHQRHNSAYLEQAGGALVISQNAWDSHQIIELLANRARLTEMAKAAKKKAMPLATSHVVDKVLKIIPNHLP